MIERHHRPALDTLELIEADVAASKDGAHGVVDRGYEGYVAKDAASAYEGGPTRRWLKVKLKGWTVKDDRWRRRISMTPSPGR